MATVELKEYTLVEVAENNGRDGKDLWIIIRDHIYDVTKFAQEHPGGVDLILEVGGKDGTKDYEDAGHSSDARSILKKLKIGRLIESERKYDKKKANAETSKEGESSKRSFISVITCGICG